MKYLKKDIEQFLNWFDNKNYTFIADLTISEYLLELSCRQEFFNSSNKNSKFREFWFSKIFSGKDINASQYQGRHSIAHMPDLYARCMKLVSEFSHERTSSTSAVRPMSIDHIKTYYELIKQQETCEGLDFVESNKKGWESSPVNLFLNNAGTKTSDLFTLIDLKYSNTEIIESLSSLLPKLRKELDLPTREKSDLAHKKFHEKLNQLYKDRIIQLLDILFFFEFKGISYQHFPTIMKILYENQYSSDSDNFVKKVFKQRALPLQTSAGVEDLIKKSCHSLYDINSVKMRDLVN
jgi:hypothetical protein